MPSEIFFTGTKLSVLSLFICSFGTPKTIDFKSNESASLRDSSYYGNYSNSLAPANENSGTKRTAGFNENWKTKNIYDLAGNVWELTSEACSPLFILRGGSYDGDGSYDPVSFRSGRYASVTNDNIGFRLRLYIK